MGADYNDIRESKYHPVVEGGRIYRPNEMNSLIVLSPQGESFWGKNHDRENQYKVEWVRT